MGLMNLIRHRGTREDNPHTGPVQGARKPLGSTYSKYQNANDFRYVGDPQASRHTRADAPNGFGQRYSTSGGSPHTTPTNAVGMANYSSLSPAYQSWARDTTQRAANARAAGNHEEAAAHEASLGNVLRDVSASRLARLPAPPPRPR